MNKVYSGAIHVTTQEKPELPSELDKCRFYLQGAGNEIAHPNGTAHQHCRNKYQGKGNGNVRRLCATVVGLHLVSWRHSCVFVMRGRLTIECVLTYIEGSNTHCSYHKGCSGTLLLIGIIRCQLVGKSETSHTLLPVFYLSYLSTSIFLSIIYLNACHPILHPFMSFP